MDKRKNQEDDKAGQLLKRRIVILVIIAIIVGLGYSQGFWDAGWMLGISCVLGLVCAWIPTIWFVNTLRNINKNTAATAAIAKENQELKEKLKSYQDDDQE